MSTAAALPFRLTICGLDELAQHRAAGVSHVVSILDPHVPPPPALAAFDRRRRLELRFHDIIDPLPGWVVPQRQDVETLLAFGRALADGPAAAHLLVHCHAGVSRSTAAAAVLLAQARPDQSAYAALAIVAARRPQAWPNLRLIELGDALLARDGDLVAAACAHYRRALQREPWLAEAMIDGGREREVVGAAGSRAAQRR